jgi:Icc-related predicted phosphoesterase
MLIYFFSDFQGAKEIPEGNPDLVVLLGDIYHTDAKEIDDMYSCPKIGIYGNHDAETEWSKTNIQLIHKDRYTLNGITFAGFGGCPRYNRKPNQFDEEQCFEFMNTLEKVDVFIAHSNPVYKPSNFQNDAHRGFQPFNDYIEEKQPKYFIHGHLHEPTIKKVKDTEIYCVYPFMKLEI